MYTYIFMCIQKFEDVQQRYPWVTFMCVCAYV